MPAVVIPPHQPHLSAGRPQEPLSAAATAASNHPRAPLPATLSCPVFFSQGTEDEERRSRPGEEEEEEEEENDWREDLRGMQPHERAEAYEARGMFREAFRWHREDLAAARARALDGEEEDERESTLDLARALRNTGRCLGRLGNSGFTEVRGRGCLWCCTFMCM